MPASLTSHYARIRGRSRTSPEPDSGVGGAINRRATGDLLAMALLVVLPVLVFGLPALLGHTVVPGDDLTQNYPLRVLAGHQISAGHLPLFDPYIWGGAPLLAGWNAGAAYPLTLLFAVMPGAPAWTLNLIATWAVAGLGCSGSCELCVSGHSLASSAR